MEIRCGEFVELLVESKESLYHSAGFDESEDYELYGLSRHVRGLLKMLGHSMDKISGECPATLVRENADAIEWENDECETCVGFIGKLHWYNTARCPCELLGCDEAVVLTVHKLKEGGWL
jgi:hypothetical protein